MRTGKTTIIALAAFAFFGLVAALGLGNTLRWYLSLPEFMASAPLPPSFWMSIGKLALQLSLALAGVAFILFGRSSSARWAGALAATALLAVHVLGWLAAHHAAAASGNLWLTHIGRAVLAVWLLCAVASLLPNNSSKPTPLRGAA